MQLFLISVDFDILLLSEIWLKEIEMPLYGIKDYTLYDDCRSMKRSGGIMVYAKKKLGFVIADSKMQTAEMIAIRNQENNTYVLIAYRYHYIKYYYRYINNTYVLCIYRDYQYSISCFCDELEGIISKLPYSNLYLIGDINIDIKEKEQNYPGIDIY